MNYSSAKGLLMEPPHDSVCKELLLDLICYEINRGRLSPEMEYLLERHLEMCLSCRREIHGFQSLLHNTEAVPNYG